MTSDFEKETSLYLIPTPIGNLEDITLRALRLLKEVDIVLAEDTRVSGKLLKHFDIQNNLRSYHAHNEHRQIEKLIAQLKEGKKIALVSDAGTPAISDPGFLLVRAAVEEGLKVECLPGPTAFVPALVKSGLPADRFVFEGFLPQKKGRKTRLEILAEESRSVIFYESPFRIVKTLSQLKEIFGSDRKASVSRELSKKFEETANGTLEELENFFAERSAKGEFVIVVEGKKS